MGRASQQRERKNGRKNLGHRMMIPTDWEQVRWAVIRRDNRATWWNIDLKNYMG